MKYLKKLESEEEKKEQEIVVHRIMKMSIDCLYCFKYCEMEGGPIGDRKAQFLCPECKRVNEVRWDFD